MKFLNIILFILPIIHISWLYNIFSLPKIVFLSLALILFTGYLVITNKQTQNYSINKEKIIFISLLSLFILSLSVSLIFSPDSYTSFYGNIQRYYWFISYVFIFIFLIYFTLFSEKKDYNTICKYIVYAGTISAIIGILYYLWWIHYEWRNIWTIWQYNVNGIYLLIPLFLSLYFAFSQKNKKFYIFSIFILIWIILTKSRIAYWLSFLGIFYIIYLFFPWFSYKKKVISIIAWIIFTVILWILSFERLQNTDANNASIQSREILYTYGINSIKDSSIWAILFWNGLESQHILLQKQIQPELYLYEKAWHIPDRAHNIIIDWLIEYGIVWCTLFLIITLIFPIIIFLKKPEKNHKDKIIIFIIISLFIWNFFWFNYPLILIINCVLTLYFINSHSHQRIQKNNYFFLVNIICFIIVFVLSTIFTKETVLNYQITQVKEKKQIENIISSDNNFIKLELLKQNYSQEINQKIINDLEKTNNPLFLEFVLSYYLNQKIQNTEKILSTSKKLYKNHPYNITAILVLKQYCKIQNSLDCVTAKENELNKLFSADFFASNWDKNSFKNRKIQQLLEYYWLNQIPK